MNESISRAAGASHGQECPPESMEAVIRAAGREPRQRTTLYGDAPPSASPPRSARRCSLRPTRRPTTTAGCSAPPS